MYRLLATGPLPSARDAIEALHQPQTAKVTMKEMAALLHSCVDDQGGGHTPAEDACVTECVRRLREAGDGGERDLDKGDSVQCGKAPGSGISVGLHCSKGTKWP